jgi:galactose mutarotase-like enzyme
MNSHTWTLIDAAAPASIGEWNSESVELPEPAKNCRIAKRRLMGGLSDGVEIVEVNSGPLRFAVVPTRGMGLWKVWNGDLEIGWRSPVRGPVHPSHVPLNEPSGLGWLDGFDELLCRCGLESNGAPEFDDKGILKYPLHGRIANVPAHRVDLNIDPESGEISLTGRVEESRFLFRKMELTTIYRVKPGESRLTIIDEVANLSGRTSELQLLYHINFGLPLLAAGAQFVAPVKTLVPRNEHSAAGLDHWQTYVEPTAGFTEQVYFFELLSDKQDQTCVLLQNAEGNQGVSLRFSKRQLPCFSLWKNTAAIVDGYVTGLEPGTNFPNPKGYEKEQGRVISLKPGARIRFEIEMEIHDSAESVQRVSKDIKRLQDTTEPQIFRQPQPGWTTA